MPDAALLAQELLTKAGIISTMIKCFSVHIAGSTSGVPTYSVYGPLAEPGRWSHIDHPIRAMPPFNPSLAYTASCYRP